MTSEKNTLFLIKLSEDNFHYWHYVEVTAAKKRLLKEVKDRSEIDVADYGNIIESGFGQNPPESLHHKLEGRYGKIEAL